MYSIKLREDFKSLRKVPAFHVSKYLIYKFIVKDCIAHFGIIIKKQICSAVQRNLLKRRLKNIIREYEDININKKGLHLFICRTHIKNANFHDLKKNTYEILKKNF